MMAEVDIKIRGLESVRHLVGRIPDAYLENLLTILTNITKISVDETKAWIMRNTGEKATGELVSSIEGIVEMISQEHYAITIGTSVAHAQYFHQGVGQAVVNHDIQIVPGRWRWIGIRPPLPAKPFTNITVAIAEEEFKKLFERDFLETSKKLDSEQKQKSDVEEGP